MSIYKFYTVLPNKGRGAAPVFKLQFPKELERSSLLLDKNCYQLVSNSHYAGIGDSCTQYSICM